MSSAFKPKFRTSLPRELYLWPSDRALPRLPVVRWHLTATGECITWHGPRIDSDTNLPERQPLPAEWVFHQLADANLDDPATVTALLDEYGVIGWPYFDRAEVPPESRVRLVQVGEPLRGRWWRERSDGTLEDARWWLKTAWAMVNTWVRHRTGGEAADAWSHEGFVDVRPDPWWRLQGALNEGLTASRPRIEYARPGFTTGLPQAGLYSAACVDIFNLLVENPEPRFCANENCGRVFVRQIGRSIYEQNRKQGVKFCSARCAKAQAQRDLYHRRKAAKNKEKKR